jgi:ribosome maturation factor RimP
MKVNKREIEILLAKVLGQEMALYDVRLRHGADPSVEILVDQHGGMNLEECARLHRKFAKESEGTAVDDYSVSFCTPGVDRNCIFPQDFLFYGDKEFELTLKDNTQVCGTVEIPDPDLQKMIVYPTGTAPIECLWGDVVKARFKFC